MQNLSMGWHFRILFALLAVFGVVYHPMLAVGVLMDTFRLMKLVGIYIITKLLLTMSCYRYTLRVA